MDCGPFEIWSRYEDLAMHFNGLLMQFRSMVGAGLAAAVTLVSYIAEGKINEPRQRRLFITATAGGAFFLLLAACLLDLLYYSALLEAAVDVIVKQEGRLPDVKMSTDLRNAVGDRGWIVALTFYVLALVALAGIAGRSMYVLAKDSRGPAR